MTLSETIELILRQHIKVDATGLSPSVASAFIVGLEEAAHAVDADLAREAEALKREIAELREALRPFAAVAEHDIGNDETDEDLFRPMNSHNRAPRLTVGSLRRARALLSKESAEQDGSAIATSGCAE